MPDNSGDVSVAGSEAFVCDRSGGLHAFKLGTGTPLWTVTVPASTCSVPATDGTNVYVTAQTRLNAYAATSGALRWSLAAGTPTPPAMSAGVVYEAWQETAGSILAAYQTSSGAKLWQTTVPDDPIAAAVAEHWDILSNLPAAALGEVVAGRPALHTLRDLSPEQIADAVDAEHQRRNENQQDGPPPGLLHAE